MKRLSLIFTIVASALCANAQLPKWLIQPTNDTIFVKVDNALLQTVTNGKSSLWSMDGDLLFTTENRILPFKENVATIVDNNSGKLVGLVDIGGNFISLPKLNVAYNNPYFENGYLACADNDSIVYYKKDGKPALMANAIKSYPFHRGYAPYLTYAQFDKQKDPHYKYYKADETPVGYKVMDKGVLREVDPKNIGFLSGIGTNGRGIAVIKNKIYWFNPDNEVFEPFLWGNDEAEKKRHLTLAQNYDEYFRNLPADSIVIKAKYGDKQIAVLRFNGELLPETFIFADSEMKFNEQEPEVVKYDSDLEFYEDGLCGLSYNSSTILPPQFEAGGLRYGNRALVKFNGKWGVVEIAPDAKMVLKLNKGEDVAFRHHKYETQIRLDLPASISAKNARIEIPYNTGCQLDKTSRETKDTESGNFVTYNCELKIPGNLPDTTVTITYEPVSVSVDNIRLLDRPLTIKAWHFKYYNVDPIDSETSISNGVASFTINVNAQKNAGESDYPFDVKVEADSVSVDYEKLSETRYKCTVSNLQEGENSLNIVVTEKGCPPSVFPFEITYTKPVPRQKKKEEVVIRKKTPGNKKRAPRLEI